MLFGLDFQGEICYTPDMTQKYAFLFPGQGSQFAGMGYDLAQNFRVAKDVFDEVDDALNQKLSELMFNGDIDTLTQTQNAQPAIMAVSVATWRVLKTEGVCEHAVCLAGHSLGEYSALCASGALTLKQTSLLIKERAKAMQEAAQINVGGMLALIGGSVEQAREIAQKSECFIANDNCPGQVVLSGRLANLTQAKIIAEQMGLKRAIPLPVSGAFHSPLMQPAQEKLASALRETTFAAPHIPVYFNVLADVQNNHTLFADLLLKQLTNAVRWRETLLNIHENNFIECGPGKVLTGLVKRTKTEANVQDTNTLESLKALFGAAQ